MDNILIEIEQFINSSNYAESTKIKYRRYLTNFANELAVITKTDISKLYLNKVYEVYDLNDKFLTYKPLNIELIDEYFSDILPRGYDVLKHNKDALGSFFNYLDRIHDFPNLMEELSININSLKPKRKITILSNHDLLKFFHYIVSFSSNKEQDVLIFILFITTGCRSSEIVNIKVRDFNWEDDTLFLPTSKGRKSKTIPLRNGICDAVKRYCAIYNLKNDNNLFSLNQHQLKKLFQDYLELAKLPKVTLHSLRHSFATIMADSGAAITQIQQLLGHEDIKTTKGYVQPNFIRNNTIEVKENKELYSNLNLKL